MWIYGHKIWSLIQVLGNIIQEILINIICLSLKELMHKYNHTS